MFSDWILGDVAGRVKTKKRPIHNDCGPLGERAGRYPNGLPIRQTRPFRIRPRGIFPRSRVETSDDALGNRPRALFQRRQRLGDNGLIVVEEAAPKRHGRHEDRQNGDQTHTHTSPLEVTRTRTDWNRYSLLSPLEAYFPGELVAKLPQRNTDDSRRGARLSATSRKRNAPAVMRRQPFVNLIKVLMDQAERG